ncbi:glycosyltransferase [Bradyrhizobium sp. NAS96.2]|uniref:glycosyltransferase n=1 Tax=Bradyrhizobium sp. NAS96.2 TaxID=1680160 RepID=UPI000B0C4A3C|nr:glycosyltransferase [Bradyrhizobium sp. NAS96.2]
MFSKLFRLTYCLFEGTRFPNLSQFARKNHDFGAVVSALSPAQRRGRIDQAIFENVNRVVADCNYALLAALLDALRPFLNPDQSSEAQEFWSALVADCRVIAEDRLLRGELNSLWGVTPIVNLRECVAADRALGANAYSLVFTTYHTSSNFDFVLSELQERVIAERGEDLYRFRWLVLIWAIANFDFFHLYNDRGIIEPAGGYGSPRFGIAVREMEIYRQAGKRLYTYAYGADHRTREKNLALGKWNFCTECPEPGVYCVCDDAGGAAMLQVIREYSTAVVAHGLAMRLIPGARNVPYLTVDVNKFSPRRSWSQGDGNLIVGHFPNHGYFKGTKYLEGAIHSLQAEGHAVELLQLSGKPHHEILEAMQKIDVLVDQLISGSFGLTAVEAMASGCPVVCYLHDGVAVADREGCPVIEANPDTIKETLRQLIADRTRLSKLGAAGPDYVRKNYSVEALGRHLADLYGETADLPKPLKATIAERTKSLSS